MCFVVWEKLVVLLLRGQYKYCKIRKKYIFFKLVWF